MDNTTELLLRVKADTEDLKKLSGQMSGVTAATAQTAMQVQQLGYLLKQVTQLEGIHKLIAAMHNLQVAASGAASAERTNAAEIQKISAVANQAATATTNLSKAHDRLELEVSA